MVWEFAPSGEDRCMAADHPTTTTRPLPQGVTRVGGTFVKAQYREYTDRSFQVRWGTDRREENLAVIVGS